MSAAKLGVYIDSPSLAGFQAFNTLIFPRQIDQMLFISDMNTKPVIGTGWSSWGASLGASICSTWSPFETTMGIFATGVYDTTGLSGNTGLVGQAQLCATYGKPLIVRLGHEFNGTWPGTYGTAHETAASFVAGYKHVVDVFRANGATNVQWCWNPNVYGKPFDHTVDPTVADSSGVNWYPGDAYVDIIALDMYIDTEDTTLYVPEDYMRASLTAVQALGPTKPFAMGEFGCSADSRLAGFCGGKSAWYNLFFTMLGTIPNLHHINQWQQPGNQGTPTDDWTISSSSTDAIAAAAFVHGVTNLPMTHGTVGLFHT